VGNINSHVGAAEELVRSHGSKRRLYTSTDQHLSFLGATPMYYQGLAFLRIYADLGGPPMGALSCSPSGRVHAGTIGETWGSVYLSAPWRFTGFLRSTGYKDLDRLVILP
jgi:hypothetical protein